MKRIIENFQHLGQTLDIQIPKTHMSPNKDNLKICSPRHTIQLLKIKHTNFFFNNQRKISSPTKELP